ncbi:unnamed protein product [Orchesella dallaii]|uniref:Uncharacterized protein n=1 Tax=Orchesella dallaii TaxID=48710 RepID=A0ABP1PNK1_9HEXA
MQQINILALFVWTFFNVQIAIGTPASLRLRSPRIEESIHLDQLVQNKSDTELGISSTNSSNAKRVRQEDTGLENVAEIVSGVLGGGGLGSIFEGSSSFIGDAGVQEEVQFVLNNVAPSLDVVLKYGWEGLKRYFGYGVTTTTPPPRVVVVVQQANQTVAAAAASATEQSVTTEEDPETKNDIVDYPRLIRSRVGSLL